MAVQFQSYISNTPWTPVEVAELLEDAFIDAGLMTNWHDSFLSGGVVNRILRIEHDATKTFGVSFYWFMFTSNGVFIHFTTGWDEVTHVPSGTQYLDFAHSTTDATTNHHRIIETSNTITFQVVRYTSTANPDYSYFILKNGNTVRRLHIYPGPPNPSFCDLDRSSFFWMEEVSLENESNGSRARFYMYPLWNRRFFLGGASNVGTGITYLPYYAATPGDAGNIITGQLRTTHSFFWPRRALNSIYRPNPTRDVINVPINSPQANPGFVTFESPLISEVPYSFYVPEVLPSDFALAATYENNTIGIFDKYIITPGLNEWEVLHVLNGTRDVNQNGATLMFLARTT